MCDYILFVIPLYNEISLAVVCYLAFFGGAKLAYGTVLQPLLKRHETDIDQSLRTAADKAGEYGAVGKAAADMLVSPEKKAE